MDVFNYAANESEYDLILIDYPLLDRYGHAFLQLTKVAEKSKIQLKFQRHFESAFNRMNTDFAQIQEFAKQNHYELIIASGHGFSPIHTAIKYQ